MKIESTNEIVLVLNRILSGAYFNKFTYGITFFETIFHNDLLKIDAKLLLSEFELEDREEWKRWLDTYPISIPNSCGPEEPARGLLMTILTQIPIINIKEENEGTLILQFENNLKVRLIGEDEISDTSWSIHFSNEEDKSLGSIYCSFNEMFLTGSENLFKILK